MENPLLKKLLVKPGNALLVDNAPENIQAILGDIPKETVVTFSAKKEIVQAALLFVTKSVELRKTMMRLLKNFDPQTVVWVVHPKKSSGIETDLGMMISWDFLNETGYQPVASAAINADWTALRIRPASQTKASGTSNEDIAGNELGHFIDPVNRIVTAPSYLQEVLEKYPEELAYFNQLAFTHKKEYIVWIVTAKQEKTRLARIEKMLQMLETKKKNPSDK